MIYINIMSIYNLKEHILNVQAQHTIGKQAELQKWNLNLQENLINKE